MDTSNLTFTDVMLPLAYGVIALGVIMGALSLLGCIGGCYTLKIILILVSHHSECLVHVDFLQIILNVSFV